MKTNILLISLALAGIFGCQNEREEPLRIEGDLVKTWRLTEYLADPGDGSGIWQPASTERNQTLQFTPDGRVIRDGAQVFTYQLSGDTIILDNQKDRFDRKWLIKELTATRLELSLPCIEPCGERYAAVTDK